MDKGIEILQSVIKSYEIEMRMWFNQGQFETIEKCRVDVDEIQEALDHLLAIKPEVVEEEMVKEEQSVEETIPDIGDVLKQILAEKEAAAELESLRPEKITGHKIDGVMTVGELKALHKGTIIHLWYEDAVKTLRCDDFQEFLGDDGNGELSTRSGFTMPIVGLSNETRMEYLDNSGWTFTVSKAVKLR